jgi:hypothetical protein
VTSQSTGPLYQPFRPPPAYSDTAALGKQELVNMLICAQIATTLRATG